MGVSSQNNGGGNSMLSEINITPLVDVMLVLLIIFMVTTPLIQEVDEEKRQVELDLPVTRDNENRLIPEDSDKMILEINGDLVVILGSEIIVDCSDKKELEAKNRFEGCFEVIESKLSNNPKLKDDGQLFLMADAEIPYGFVVGAMARIKKAGVDKLGMVTNPEYVSD